MERSGVQGRAGHCNCIRLQLYTIQVIDGCKPSHLRTICSTSWGFYNMVTVSWWLSTGYTARTEKDTCYKPIGAHILPEFWHIWIAVHARYRHCFLSIKSWQFQALYLYNIMILCCDLVNCNSKSCKWPIIRETVQIKTKNDLSSVCIRKMGNCVKHSPAHQ